MGYAYVFIVPTLLRGNAYMVRHGFPRGTVGTRKTIYRQKLTALTELKQSILQKAFAGQLTMEN